MKTLQTLLVILVAIWLTGNVQPGSPLMWAIDHSELWMLAVPFAIGAASFLIFNTVTHIGNPLTWWYDFKNGKINF